MNKNLEITKKRVLNTFKEEYDYIDPIHYESIDKCFTLLEEVSKQIKDFPLAWVSIDEEGRMRLTWSKSEGDAQVRLMLKGEEYTSYLYYEHNKDYGIHTPVDVNSLALLLEWLDNLSSFD